MVQSARGCHWAKGSATETTTYSKASAALTRAGESNARAWQSLSSYCGIALNGTYRLNKIEMTRYLDESNSFPYCKHSVRADLRVAESSLDGLLSH